MIVVPDEIPADSPLVRPTLTVNVRLKGKEIVDASLNPASRIFFEKIASELAHTRQHGPSSSMEPPEDHLMTACTHAEDGQASPEASSADSGDEYETVEVPLVFDSQFFRMLHTDVNGIDDLQAEEQQRMNAEITDLGKEIALVTKPTRFHKTDLEPWRYILELYVEAEVFFATQEQTHGTRSSQNALTQLQWFQSQVEKKKFAKQFRIQASQAAFARFLRLNANLLKYLQFQELNQLAVRKILKSKKGHTHLVDLQPFR